ncbi:hypothetical protein B0O99DRAFT_667802 [Bisporella sp. PMI_857]|nr:hypothetical protein B0O99DRAFT_667802 [Bisporella sp. PMI_857]
MTTVYEGVGGGGDLFAGLKFFLYQRIPTRNTWKDLIEANGGELVNLETKADILVADHARKDPPTGSISWTFIDKSVRNGILEDIEDHRAGSATQAPRSVASGQPTRKGRTPFTAEDDNFLTDWVVSAERAGGAIKGNQIYEELERKNNRHTAQSWRDRWVKYVSKRPRPEVIETASSLESSVPVNRTARDAISSGLESRVSKAQQLVKTLSKPAEEVKGERGSTILNPWIAKSAGGKVFTKREDQLLRDNYEEIMDIQEDMEFDAWAAWAVVHDNHTPQEWRNHFIKHIRPTVEKKGKENNNLRPQPTTALEPQSHQSPRIVPSPIQTKSATTSGEKNSNTEAIDSQYAARIRGDVLRRDEKQFNTFVTELSEEIEVRVDFNPIICGRKVPLYRIWEVVTGFGGVEKVNVQRLWPKVARRLNLEDFRHSDAPKQLNRCYEIILSHVEALRKEYYELSLHEQAEIDAQLCGSPETGAEEAEEMDEDDEYGDLDIPRSLPQSRALASTPSGKGSVPIQKGRPQSPDGSIGNKRQRIEKRKSKTVEVPSTPEEIISGLAWPTPHSARRIVASPILGEENDDEPLSATSYSSSRISSTKSESPKYAEPVAAGQIDEAAGDPNILDDGSVEWTRSDDEALGDNLSAEFQRVVAKHGWKKIRSRRRLLRRG